MFRRKKHEFVKAECEEIEMHGSRNDARKFFQTIKRMSEASFCKNQDGNMMTDIRSSLELWRAHFNATLNGDDTNNPANDLTGQTLWTILPQLQHQTGKKWPWPFNGLNSTKPAVKSLLNFLKQEDMYWFAACTTFSATYGHWKE